jgi:phosphoserine aminotransferase
MYTFHVGPAKVYPQLKVFLADAYEEGILSMPHRGEAFVQMMQSTIALLKEKLEIPQDYTIMFASSATECWEVVAQSLTLQKSYHIYSGAFGEKWFRYTQKIRPEAQGFALNLSEDVSLEKLQKFFGFAERRSGSGGVIQDKELICFTQNETSNGSQIPMDTIRLVKETFPRQLIALDATSSMAGVLFDWLAGDVWYASVQKCFGLPAGLSVLVLSPRAAARVVEINERNHYNSLVQMYEQIQKYQTTHTPNVLGLYLLKRTLETVPSIGQVAARIEAQAAHYYQLFSSILGLEPLIENKALRSNTVVAVQGAPEKIQAIKAQAREAGLLLGNGYDRWKEDTFRVANFPAISPEEMQALTSFFLHI